VNRSSAIALVSVAVVVVVLVTLQWRKGRTSAADEEEAARKQAAHRKDIALVVEKRGAAAKAKIDALKAVAKDAKGAPPLAARQPVAALAALKADDRLKGGLLVVTASWDDATAKPAPVGIDDEWLKGLDDELRNGSTLGRSPEALDVALGLLSELRHVALVRVHRYDTPKAALVGSEWQYTGGRAAGEVRVYDLETKAKVGGFPFEITQRDTAFVRGKTAGALDTELEKDFRSEVKSKFADELGAFLGGKPGGRDK
jgi:hypothetical protein